MVGDYMELYQMRPFEYFKPSNLNEALSLLKKKGEGAKVIAGGTEIVIYLKSRQMSPKSLIDISDLNLDFIKADEKFLRIGPLTTHNTLEKSSLIKEKAGILGEAANQIGTAQLRNIGTLGGNLCNASPAADTATPLLVLGASLKLMNLSGERFVPIENFFLHVKKTLLQSDELLTEIQIPYQPPKTGAVFMKLGRRTSHDLSIVNVATKITMKKDVCEDSRIALGSVAPTPIRARNAEKHMVGKKFDEALIEKASEIASQETSPISDVRASAEYRKAVSKALVRTTIQRVIDLIGA